MNQRLVDSVAQTILSMSVEERQLLDSKLKNAEQLAEASELNPKDKSFRVAEIAQDIQFYEAKYSAVTGAALAESSAPTGNSDPAFDGLEKGVPLRNSFLRVAQSLQLDGPEDLSTNVDHYLYGLPKRDA